MIVPLAALLVVPLGLLRLAFWVVDHVRAEARGLEREQCAVELEAEACRLSVLGYGPEYVRGVQRAARALLRPPT